VWYKGALKEKIDIRHIAADGNFVYLHTRAIENGKPVAVMDIYRVENGKILEHWDVTQAIPEHPVNKHPMF
jgi:predicted SnoaL-like aldol condensation-catalyzing enzyme